MRILYVTTLSLTMNCFFHPHIEMLVREGNHVDIACNYRALPLDGRYSELGCHFYQIDFSRFPLSFGNIKAVRQLEKVIKGGEYDIVHCHTPNASVITRLVCGKFRKKNGIKVFYTAHGFHFYKGAPKYNWLLYYPVEKFCSRFTDKLITINREDYDLASRKFKACEVHCIPGIGIDLLRFANIRIDRNAERRKIGITEKSFMLLSVGELNANKNHRLVIQALAKLKDPNVHYVIAGDGKLRSDLLTLAEKLHVEKQVHLLGYQKNVANLYKIADIYVHPSFREGLPVAVMEALASGTTVLASDTRGCRDLVSDNLFDPNDPDSLVEKLRNYSPNGALREIFLQKNVFEHLSGLYRSSMSLEI